MPNIGSIDVPRKVGETPLELAIRAELAKFVFKEWPALTLPTQESRSPDGWFMAKATWNDTGRAVALDVLDYIVEFAAKFAIDNAALLYNNSARTNSTGTAKAWIAGFFDWYMGVANIAFRDDSASQPNFLLTVERGNLLLAQKHCRNIVWTDTDVNRHNSLWNSDCGWPSLERVNMNLMGCTVSGWKNAVRRLGAGTIWLPCVVTYKMVSLELGDEVLSDWLSPPDPGHGHPFSTLVKAFNEKKPRDRVNHSSDTATRKSYRLLMPGGYWRLAVNEGATPLIITFFKEV